jgi:tRNA dimethylallyltransferase
MSNKLLVILGPTASGKTDLSIKLAKKFNGEIISADSRQIYRGMDIGSGKVTKKEMKNIPHYLLDVASPKKRFAVTQYRKLALKAIKDIQKRGKLPILVGGTAFYIQAVIDGITIPEVKADWKLRKQLEKEDNLYEILKKLDPQRAETIDKDNPRRLIRAIEIVLKTKKPIPKIKQNPIKSDVLIIGITKNNLKELINKRLFKRLKNGMIAEIKNLRSIISWKRLEEFGLEYRFIAQYLQGKISKQTMIDKIQKESEHFAKRQMTWFKKDKRINWIKNYKESEKLLKKFLQ